MNRILVIIVNYYTEHEVCEQVAPFQSSEVGFIVVDNGSRSDNRPENRMDSLRSLPQVRVVVPGENLGYLNGGFFGFRAALASGCDPDWVVVGNPDVLFNDQFFETLSRIDSHGPAMIAPRLVSSRTGSDQNPYLIRRLSRRRLEMLASLHKYRLPANLYRIGGEIRRRLKLPETPAAGPGDRIYAPHGACLIMSGTFLKRLPALHYPSFLFCEEIFLAEQARRLHLPVFYRPDLALVHGEHRTTGFFRNRKLLRCHAESLDYCLKAFYD